MYAAKKTLDPISTGRRPTLSAAMLSVSDPASMPNTGSSSALLTPHSWMMTGATKPMTWTSKPSITTVRPARMKSVSGSG